MSHLQVILYGYDASPFVTKVKKLLLLKGIPYKNVNLAMIPPRPELLTLGIPYRRVPVLAIGNDVYCDSTLIIDVLERRFPPSDGYPSFYPPRVGSQGRADTGLAKALSTYWVNNVVQSTAIMTLDFGAFPKELQEDREKFFGAKIDMKSLNETRGARASALASHLTLFEEQLSDGRQYIFDTDRPGLLDIQAYLVFSWMHSSNTSSPNPHGQVVIEGFPECVREIFDPAIVPKTLEWLERTKTYLTQLSTQEAALVSTISGSEAAKIILSSPREDAQDVVGFEQAEGHRLGVTVGDTVSVVPTDTAFVPSVGQLVALSRQEVVLDVQGDEGKIRLHFPRLEFAVTKAAST